MTKRSLLMAVGMFAGSIAAFGPAADARPIAPLANPASATATIDFSIHLPLRNAPELDSLIANQASATSPLYHHWLTPAQFRASFGPDTASVARVIGMMHAAGLQALQTSSQVVSVRGAAPAVERLFSTQLSRVTSRATGQTRLASQTTMTVPAALTAVGATVLNLHAGIPLRPMFQRTAPGQVTQNRYGPEGGYWADDLKQAYQFPAYATASGKGVSIAIVDGGDFSDSDLALYLQHERIGPLKTDLIPAPKTYHNLLPGAHPFSPNSGDSFEANLDVQQIAMTAPGASVTAFILPDDSDGSFFDAYVQMIESNAYDVVSTSYGGCELGYTPAYNRGTDYTGILVAQNDLFKQGNSQGMTFVVSSGDEGALSCPQPGYFLNKPTSPATVYNSVLGVDSFADMPNVTGVGGGDLTTSAIKGSLRSTYVRETGIVAPLPLGDPYGTGNLLNENFAAGGGKSVIFSRPDYQRLVSTGSSMRTVPDVGGHIGAYTITGSYDAEYFGGELVGVLGTSASAPDFAALLALKVAAQHSRLGQENQEIYQLGAHNHAFGYYYLHDRNASDDGYYQYTRDHHGYNYVYGVGSPIAQNFDFLPFSAPAGDPQTATNP